MIAGGCQQVSVSGFTWAGKIERRSGGSSGLIGFERGYIVGAKRVSPLQNFSVSSVFSVFSVVKN